MQVTRWLYRWPFCQSLPYFPPRVPDPTLTDSPKRKTRCSRGQGRSCAGHLGARSPVKGGMQEEQEEDARCPTPAQLCRADSPTAAPAVQPLLIVGDGRTGVHLMHALCSSALRRHLSAIPVGILL